MTSRGWPSASIDNGYHAGDEIKLDTNPRPAPPSNPDCAAGYHADDALEEMMEKGIGIQKMEAGTGITFKITAGDVNSEEMGTAARANGGKPRFDLMPLGQVADLLNTASCLMDLEAFDLATDSNVVKILGDFQRGLCSAEILLTICISYAAKSMPKATTVLDVLEPVCHVWEYGLHKYAEWNWAKGAPWWIPMGCIVRHLNACMKDPDSMDEDSGYSHQAHMICNAMMLVHYEQYWNTRGPQADSRPYQYFQKPDVLSKAST